MLESLRKADATDLCRRGAGGDRPALEALLERIETFRGILINKGARLVQPERGADAILDRAWRMLSMRRLVVRQGATYVILPRQRPLLEYYANSISHFV